MQECKPPKHFIVVVYTLPSGHLPPRRSLHSPVHTPLPCTLFVFQHSLPFALCDFMLWSFGKAVHFCDNPRKQGSKSTDRWCLEDFFFFFNRTRLKRNRSNLLAIDGGPILSYHIPLSFSIASANCSTVILSSLSESTLSNTAVICFTLRWPKVFQREPI